MINQSCNSDIRNFSISIAQGSSVVAASFNCCMYAARLRILEKVEAQDDKVNLAKRLLKCLTIHCTVDPMIPRSQRL